MSPSPPDTIYSTFSDTSLVAATGGQNLSEDPVRAWIAFGALVLVIALIFVLREATRDGINPP